MCNKIIDENNSKEKSWWEQIWDGTVNLVQSVGDVIKDLGLMVYNWIKDNLGTILTVVMVMLGLAAIYSSAGWAWPLIKAVAAAVKFQQLYMIPVILGESAAAIYAAMTTSAIFASMSMITGFFKNITVGDLNTIDNIVIAISGLILSGVALMGIVMSSFGVYNNAVKKEEEKVDSSDNDTKYSPTGYRYSGSVLNKWNNDKYHSFSIQKDQDILSSPILERTDGRIEYAIRGYINNTEGVYHITTRDNKIIHRSFFSTADWLKQVKNQDLPEFSQIP